jgi:hypothetical protein
MTVRGLAKCAGARWAGCAHSGVVDSAGLKELDLHPRKSTLVRPPRQQVGRTELPISPGDGSRALPWGHPSMRDGSWTSMRRSYFCVSGTITSGACQRSSPEILALLLLARAICLLGAAS